MGAMGAWDLRWRSCLSELSQANILQVSLQPGALAVPQSRHRDDENGDRIGAVTPLGAEIEREGIANFKKGSPWFSGFHTASVSLIPDRESEAEQACTMGAFSKGLLLGGVGVTGRGCAVSLGLKVPALLYPGFRS